MLQLPSLSKQLLQNFKLVLMVVLASIAGNAQSEFSPESAAEYRLGAGDRVQIDVYDEVDLGMITTISQSGDIAYPFLGDLHVIELTPKEVERLITAGLKGAYLADPQVSVTIIEYRPFYIGGAVKNSGAYPYQPGLTLRKALSLAGGFTEKASQTKITVVRDSDHQKKSAAIALDDFVKPGDTINVGQSFF